MLFDPDAHIGDGEFQVLAEAVRAGAEVAGAPVVNRRDGHAHVGGELADVEQRLQAPGATRRVMFGVHTEQVRSAPTHESGATDMVSPLPERGGREGRNGVKVMGFR